jgi:hypothetical protein
MKDIIIVKEIFGLFQENINTPNVFKIRTFNKICFSKFVPSHHKNGPWSIFLLALQPQWA